MATPNEADLIKSDLIKLLSSLKGLPKERQEHFNEMLKMLKDPDYVITKEQLKEFSLLLAYLFCGQSLQNFPMTADNKKLLENYSKKHLDITNPKPSPVKHGKKG